MYVHLMPSLHAAEGTMCLVKWGQDKLVVYTTNKGVHYMGLYQVMHVCRISACAHTDIYMYVYSCMCSVLHRIFSKHEGVYTHVFREGFPTNSKALCSTYSKEQRELLLI